MSIRLLIHSYLIFIMLKYAIAHLQHVKYTRSNVMYVCRYVCTGTSTNVMLGGTVPLKVVCRLALTIWSYWHGCREQIFLNISNASNSMETP